MEEDCKRCTAVEVRAQGSHEVQEMDSKKEEDRRL